MKKTQVQAMMMLRIAGVSIPPQLMRGPYDPGYREREPSRVSVSAARPGVKDWKGKVTERGKVIHPRKRFGECSGRVRVGAGCQIPITRLLGTWLSAEAWFEASPGNHGH